MDSQCPRSKSSRLRSILMHNAALLAAGALIPATFAQPIRADSIPVKNWSPRAAADQVPSAQSASVAGSASGLVYIAITPCRIMDTRSQGGSGKTGAFGPPSLVAGQARVIPVPSSNCGVPIAAAY